MMNKEGGEASVDMDGEKDNKVDLRVRTRTYAMQIIRLYTKIPGTPPAQVIGKQLLRSGTSVGAHYREAARAKSDADFISKLEGALQELDETLYWIELLEDAQLAPKPETRCLVQESDELIRILVRIVKKVKARRIVPANPI
jgi:four helix bundle protein